MLNRGELAVAEFGQRERARRSVDLLLLISELRELPLGEVAASRFERPLDLLAVRLDARIIDPVRCVPVKTFTDFLRCADLVLSCSHVADPHSGQNWWTNEIFREFQSDHF